MANEWQPTLAAFVQGLEAQEGSGYALSMLPTLVRIGQENGLSGQSIKRALSDAGVPISDYRLYTTIAQLNASVVQAESIGGHDLTGIPGEDAFTAWSTEKAEGYVYRFTAAYDQLNEAGEVTETIWKDMSVVSRNPIAVGDAMADMNDLLATSNPAEYSQAYRGLTLKNMYYMSPF